VADPQPADLSTAEPLSPRALHLRAMDNLRFIRQMMEGAAYFTAVSGLGEVAVGLTALAAAWIAGRQRSPWGWLAVWLAEALVGLAVSVIAIVRKARRTDVELLSRPVQRFALGLLPPFLAGGVLTAVLFSQGLYGLLPGLWLLLYGTGVVMGLGALALVSPAGWGNAYLAAGFGGLHLLFGAVIAWRHGG